MYNFVRHTSKKSGHPPGTLLHIGEKKVDEAAVSMFHYSAAHARESHRCSIDECFQMMETPGIAWININGLHDIGMIEKAGARLDLHPLVMEDIVNTTQRPKLDDFDSYVFLSLQMLRYDRVKNEVVHEQISIVLAENIVITFQEAEGDVFDYLRERIRQAKGRIRRMGADYLCYALVDAIVDGYFEVLEAFGERIEDLEEELVNDPGIEIMQAIHAVRQEMIFVRKSIWPLREIVGELQRGESQLITSETGIYFRDVYDHAVRLIETAETFRDVISGMMDMHMTSVSNRMNEVMKVLTVIATIFIPLTFIAGIYGMNFKYMPELEWRWSYPVLWGVLLAVGIAMLILFRKKKWL